MKLVKLKFILLILSCVGCYALMSLFSPNDSLDTRFFYTPDEAKKYLDFLSDEQRINYLINEIIDLFFIVNYSTIFFIISSRCRFKNIYAVLTGTFDVVETGLIIVSIHTTVSMPLFYVLSGATFLKWISLGIFFLRITFNTLISKRAKNLT